MEEVDSSQVGKNLWEIMGKIIRLDRDSATESRMSIVRIVLIREEKKNILETDWQLALCGSNSDNSPSSLFSAHNVRRYVCLRSCARLR